MYQSETLSRSLDRSLMQTACLDEQPNLAGFVRLIINHGQSSKDEGVIPSNDLESIQGAFLSQYDIQGRGQDEWHLDGRYSACNSIKVTHVRLRWLPPALCIVPALV